jgi:hypothetical protein
VGGQQLQLQPTTTAAATTTTAAAQGLAAQVSPQVLARTGSNNFGWLVVLSGLLMTIGAAAIYGAERRRPS